MFDAKYWRVEMVEAYDRIDSGKRRFDTEIKALEFAADMARSNPGFYWAVLETTSATYMKAPRMPAMEVVEVSK